MRLLQAARISKDKDDSTSVEKQDADMRRWAQANEHEIVGTAKDTDVSGSKPPWERPALGPWLTDMEKISQYDGILSSHLDRLGRSTNDYMELLKWCETHHKTIITSALGDKIDFSKGTGKLIGFVIMWLGEQELENTKRRTRETFEWLRDKGYLTGKCPFGFRIVEILVDGKKRKIIEPDPINAPYVFQMVERYLAGQTTLEICEWLDSEGVRPAAWKSWSKADPAERGPEPIWQQSSIMQLFTNPVLIGHLVSDGEIVRTGDGQPLKRCAPILEDEQWTKLQAKLDTSPKRKSTAPKDTSLLTGVLFCPKCDGPMYRLTSTRKHPNGNTYTTVYYRCHGTGRAPSKCRNMVKMDDVEAKVDDWITSHKSIEITETRIVKGNAHGQQIAEVRQAMKDLDPARADYDTVHAGYRAEFVRLSQLAPEPDRIETVFTGRTLAGEWPTMPQAERHQTLRDGGFTVTAVKIDGKPVVEVTPGDAYKAQLDKRKLPHPRGPETDSKRPDTRP
jgi:site-specific DNA recombinase